MFMDTLSKNVIVYKTIIDIEKAVAASPGRAKELAPNLYHLYNGDTAKTIVSLKIGVAEWKQWESEPEFKKQMEWVQELMFNRAVSKLYNIATNGVSATASLNAIKTIIEYKGDKYGWSQAKRVVEDKDADKQMTQEEKIKLIDKEIKKKESILLFSKSIK